MSQPPANQPPEDFAAESEVDDTTRLASRRTRAHADTPAQPEGEPDDATRLTSRRGGVPVADEDDSTRLSARRPVAAPAEELDDSTRLSTRRPVPQAEVEPDDSTRLSTRRPAAPSDGEPDDVTLLGSQRTATRPQPPELDDDSTVMSSREDAISAAHTRSERSTSSTSDVPAAAATDASLPPGGAPLGMHVREGGFGTRSAAYAPRSVDLPGSALPPASAPSASAEQTDRVLTPEDAKRKRESAQRSSTARAVAVAAVTLVLGTAAVVGIVLLVRGLL